MLQQAATKAGEIGTIIGAAGSVIGAVGAVVGFFKTLECRRHKRRAKIAEARVAALQACQRMASKDAENGQTQS